MRAGVVALGPRVPLVALAEARDWLGLSTSADDGRLSALLAVACETAEAFLGQTLIARDVTERVAADAGWRSLALNPVRAITGAAAVVEGQAGRALGPADWAVDIGADGTGHVRVLDAGGAGQVDVAYRAGLAADWTGVPEAVRHGVLRLATELYRERDGAAGLMPSAAIAALWRPFRRMSLSPARRTA